MATKIQNTCDACGKAIDPAQGYINLNPLRGGYIIEVGTPFGSANQRFINLTNLCGPACLTKFIGKLADTIEVPTPAAPAAPTPAAAPGATKA